MGADNWVVGEFAEDDFAALLPSLRCFGHVGRRVRLAPMPGMCCNRLTMRYSLSLK